ncbi:hypothetical protein [Desulfobulbus propionicus]|jgi:hypothetical protein
MEHMLAFAPHRPPQQQAFHQGVAEFFTTIQPVLALYRQYRRQSTLVGLGKPEQVIVFPAVDGRSGESGCQFSGDIYEAQEIDMAKQKDVKILNNIWRDLIHNYCGQAPKALSTPPFPGFGWNPGWRHPADRALPAVARNESTFQDIFHLGKKDVRLVGEGANIVGFVKMAGPMLDQGVI